MNRETLQARVVLLQQNVQIQAQQLESQADNLKILRGHLSEAQHWLNQFDAQVQADALTNEGVNDAIEEGNEPESDPVEHQDGDCSGEETEPSGSDCV